MKPLVSTAELAANPGWRRFDCRHDLFKPELGAQQYREGHIPGALFAAMEHDLSGAKTGRNGRHPLPELDAFIAWMGRQGLKPSDTIVCYDGSNGSMASRLWWMLRWAGHDAVAVLDGGLARWVKEGRPVTSEAPSFPASAYPAKPKTGMAVDAAYVAAHRDRSLLVDARAPARFRGEQEPIDPVAGHIPGAVNHFNNDNVNADGTFKDAATLKSQFASVLGDRSTAEIVNYCGSGVSACHNLLAMEIAGLTGSKLYAGSWSEWIADPTRPRS
ncbi:MAG: sulfurtransferase [Betaproteobacteria bacterium]